ncbi:hypothetical protein [Bacillus sp. Marseille-P3661]|uniref:hypothetical protein n=1 Tax=Bacillus sp. Marseille-P3661 TaxID=1936234 RepID=UPI000C826F23|nr:hypothetical protein [Bacillus sp. Marseille-P3661]
MKKISMFIIIVGVFIGLVGCNTTNENIAEDTPKEENAETNENTKDAETESNEESQEEQPEQPEQALPELEEQKTVNMMLEGMAEEKVVNVHHHKELGFSTYVPDDMVVESNSDTFNVFTNFGGTKNEDATLKIKSQTETQLIEELEGNGFTIESQDQKAYDFSEKEFSLQKEGMIGRAAIFKHNTKEYTLYYYFPEDYADGFGPRSEIIVSEIVWHDEQQ